MFGDPKAFVVLIVLEHFRFDHFELVQIFQYELEEMAEHDHLHINCVCMDVHEAVKRLVHLALYSLLIYMLSANLTAVKIRIKY